jgi:hypothetical protein
MAFATTPRQLYLAEKNPSCLPGLAKTITLKIFFTAL